ncbi:hypothetical protein ABIA39_008424 [Nocardia sp. GAS34]|uniref:hypothetical protein n=1 Tax=unclassified Nocardia TaxID=2637762 RepID=UPI003D1E15A2
MHTVIMDVQQLWRVTLAALVFGAGLPLTFAVGVRYQSAGRAGTLSLTRRRTALAIAALCYAIVLAVVVAGVLYVAKDFLATRLGIHLF